MSKRLLIPSASLGLLALVGALTPPAAHAGAEFKVGIVDMEQVLSSYELLKQRSQTAFEQNQNEFKTLQQALDLESLQSRVDTTDANSKAGQRARFNLDNAKRRLEMEDRLLNAAFQREFAKLESEAQREVQTIVDEVAAALGLHLVLRSHALPEGLSIAATRDRLDRRVVLYRDAELDITPLVIERLPKGSAGAGTPTDSSSGGR